MQTQNQKNFSDADSKSEELCRCRLNIRRTFAKKPYKYNVFAISEFSEGRHGTGREGTGRDGKGRDGTGQDGTGRDGRDGKERDRMGGRADQGMWELLGTWMGGGGGEAARIRPNPP